jgi:F5/8 type C domain.
MKKVSVWWKMILVVVLATGFAWADNGGKLAGTVIGNEVNGQGGTTNAMVFDGNTSTFFDATDPYMSNAWMGLDLGTATSIGTIRFYPRASWGSRMNGGKFQGSNAADFSSGVVDLYTIATNPPEAGHK